MLLRNLLAFGRLLRRLGLDVHPGRMLDVAEALQHVDIRVRDDVYHACRALLVHRYEDLAIFDRAFDAFWNNRRTEVPTPADTCASRTAVLFIKALRLASVESPHAVRAEPQFCS